MLNNHKISQVTLMYGTILAGFAFATTASAQVADQSGQSVTADNSVSEGSIEDIIVTATRRSENLQSVPISVSAISSAQLASRGITQTADLAATVPNLQISSQYGETQPNFTLRGIGVANDYTANSSSPVGVYIDNVYQAFRFTQGLQLYDLEQIEVLRGPQGTLFGRNTTGGAVNIFTRKPRLEGTNGYVTLGYGNYERKKIEGAFEVTPVDGMVGLRIAATKSKGDGYFKEVNPANNIFGNTQYGTSDSIGVRATLRIAPNDRLDISIKGYYAKDNPVGMPIVFKGLIGGVPGTSFAGYSREANHLAYDEFQLGDAGNYYTRTGGGALEVKYELSDNWSLTSDTGYSEARLDIHEDTDGTPQNLFGANYNMNTTDFGQDIRVNYNSDNLKFVVGLYYGRDTALAVNTYRIFNILPDAMSALDFNGGGVDPSRPGTSFNVQHGYNQKRTSMASYGEATYNLTDKIELSGGLRFTHDKVQFLDAFSNIHTDFPGALIIHVYGPLDQTLNSDNLSGRAIVSYKLTDKVRTYVSYSRGYRSGAFNGFGYAGPDQVYSVKPENLTSYEFGFKSRFVDDKLQLNVAAYHYDYTGQQLTEIISSVGFIRSVDSKINGAELEVLSKLITGVTMRGSVGFSDSSFNKNQTLSGLNIGGNQLPFSSKWTFNIGGDWTAIRTDVGKLVLSGEYTYQSKFFYDPFNGQNPGFLNIGAQPGAENYLSQAGYGLVSGRIAFVSDKYTIALWGKNITNKRYLPVGYDTTGAYGGDFYTPGIPRTYGVEATLRF